MAAGDLLLAAAFEQLNEYQGTTVTGGTVAPSATQKHTGASALRVNRTSNATVENFWQDLPSGLTDVRGSFYLYGSTRPTVNVTIWSIFSRSNCNMNLQMNSSGVLTSRINNIVAATTTTSGTIATIAAATWTHIEFQYHSTATLLTFSVRVNGGTAVTITLAATAAYGVTSPIFGTDVTFGTGNVTSTYDMYYDDLVLFQDSTGGSFTGDFKVVQLIADAAAADLDTTFSIVGASSTRNEALSHFTVADPPTATNEISSITNGQINRAQMTTYTLGAGESCLGVYPAGEAGSNGVNAAQLTFTLQNAAGTDHATVITPQINSNGLFGFNARITAGVNMAYTLTPAGTSWTQTDIDGIRFKLSNTGTTGSGNPCVVAGVALMLAIQIVPQDPNRPINLQPKGTHSLGRSMNPAVYRRRQK